MDKILKIIEAKETMQVVKKVKASTKTKSRNNTTTETMDYANNQGYNPNYRRSEGDWINK